MGYVIIPKPRYSSRDGINSGFRSFDLLLLAVLVQSFAAMIAVVAAHVVAGDRSTVTGVTAPVRQVARWSIQLARDAVFTIVFGCFFAYENW